MVNNTPTAIRKKSLIQLQVGVAEVHRHAVAALYHAAFRQMLTPIVGADAQGITLLAEGLNLAQGIVALVDGQVVGVAAIYSGAEHLVTLRPSRLIAIFGWWSGLQRIALGAWLGLRAAEGDLVLDGIAVDEVWRGQGVGTALLQAVIDYAKENGYRTVWLNVAANNPHAQQWYQRAGFMPMTIKRTDWFTRRLGFESVTTMAKVVG